MYLPPLDPSSNPSSSSVTPKTSMRLQRCESGIKLRRLNDDVVEERNVMQIEPEITQENKLVSESEAGFVPHITDPPTKEETQRMSAKEELYKLCKMKHWKAPVYECCDDEGPCHKKLFTFKTMIGIEEDSRITTVLECFGEPQHKKKVAGEKAAEAALWYLKNVGHTLRAEKASVVIDEVKMTVKVEPCNGI